MKETVTTYEKKRVQIQGQLDKRKSATERNKLGQFATPTQLAQEIMSYGLSLLPKHENVRFLDPAIGTGSFYSALLETARGKSIDAAEGFEIDKHYGEPSRRLWEGHNLKIHLADFTKENPPNNGFNLLICNPPYVRHHHLTSEDKVRLRIKSNVETGLTFSGLAGLYCHFMALSHRWMSEGGIAGWLVPSEFMDVNYGQEIKRYLLQEVTLLRIHRFDPTDVQFDDALVSSAVVWFKKSKPNPDDSIIFTFGGTHDKPVISRRVSISDLLNEPKWTRFPSKSVRKRNYGLKLSDLFDIKRGVATGNNKFFILTKEEIDRLELPSKFFRPILPSPRYLLDDEVFADQDGNPILQQSLFLLDCRLTEEQVEEKHPTLWKYLKSGKTETAKGYLCKSRKVWFWQEDRQIAPLVCTYMGRGTSRSVRPFRFILNHSKAIAANTYLMLYPKPLIAERILEDSDLLRTIWEELNLISTEFLISEGRVYGGGLHKMEPKELANLPIRHLRNLLNVISDIIKENPE